MAQASRAWFISALYPRDLFRPVSQEQRLPNRLIQRRICLKQKCVSSPYADSPPPVEVLDPDVCALYLQAVNEVPEPLSAIQGASLLLLRPHIVTAPCSLL